MDILYGIIFFVVLVTAGVWSYQATNEDMKQTVVVGSRSDAWLAVFKEKFLWRFFGLMFLICSILEGLKKVYEFVFD